MAQLNSPADSTGDSDLVMEREIGGAIWIVCGLITAACLAGAVLLVVNYGTKQLLFVGILSLIGLAGSFLTAIAFKVRDEKTLFFRDRVERFKKDQVVETLRYDDVQYVGYGFRSDNEQFLSFSGTDKSPKFVLHFGGEKPSDDKTEITEDKALALRDLLYEVIASRMIEQAHSDRGTPWFGPVRIKSIGLATLEGSHRWEQVEIDANEQNGQVVVRGGGIVLGRASMIEDNVTAGLIAIEKLRNPA